MKLNEGGIGIFGFGYFFRSVFRFLCQNTAVLGFSCSLRFADFSFFSIWFSVFVINALGFSVLAPDVVFGFSYFVPFGFRFLFDLSGNWYWKCSRETPNLFRGMCEKPNVTLWDHASLYAVFGFGRIFLRFCGFGRFFLRFCGFWYTPMSPSLMSENKGFFSHLRSIGLMWSAEFDPGLIDIILCYLQSS